MVELKDTQRTHTSMHSQIGTHTCRHTHIRIALESSSTCTHTHTHMCVSSQYLEQAFEHDVYDLVLLVDVVQLHQVLQGVQLILPLRLKQALVWQEGVRMTVTHTQLCTHTESHTG